MSGLESDSDQVKSWITRRLVNVLIGIGIFSALLLFLGVVFPVEVLFQLSFGFIPFVLSRSSQATVDSLSIVLGIVAWLGFVGIIYGLIKSRVNEIKGAGKRIKISFMLGLLIIAGFGIGFAAIGTIHQVVWILGDNEPWLSNSFDRSRRRSESKNNLKQIGLGLHNFHDVYGHLPSAAEAPPEQFGYPQSWQTLVLPYTENEALYEQIDFSVPWSSESNRKVFETVIPIFHLSLKRSAEKLATHSEDGFAVSDYAGNNQIFSYGRHLTMSEIRDGPSNVIMVGEVITRLKPWGDPTNTRDLTLGINKSPEGFGSHSKGGSNFVMGDGRVVFLSENTDHSVLRALSTPSGGEKVEDDAF